MSIKTEITQHLARDLVTNNVIHCASRLIARLATLALEGDEEYSEEIERLIYGSIDWEEAAISWGWSMNDEDSPLCLYGGEALTAQEARARVADIDELDDLPVVDPGEFYNVENGEVRHDWEVEPGNWEELCRVESIDGEDYRAEPLEFWVVSDWLADRLREKGEAVEEVYDFTIWGRRTSGQAIYIDTVIQEIAQDRSNP